MEVVVGPDAVGRVLVVSGAKVAGVVEPKGRSPVAGVGAVTPSSTPCAAGGRDRDKMVGKRAY